MKRGDSSLWSIPLRVDAILMGSDHLGVETEYLHEIKASSVRRREKPISGQARMTTLKSGDCSLFSSLPTSRTANGPVFG
jgi:hypothetical protein